MKSSPFAHFKETGRDHPIVSWLFRFYSSNNNLRLAAELLSRTAENGITAGVSLTLNIDSDVTRRVTERSDPNLLACSFNWPD